MDSLYGQELSIDEINQVAGGVPVPLLIAGGIFLAGVAVSAYNAYCDDDKRSREKSSTAGKRD